MTRPTLAACGAILLTAALSAQTPAAPAPPTQPGGAVAQPMTLTGCLKPWDPSTMGASGAASPGASSPGAGPAEGAKRFVLTGAEHAAAPGAGATTTPGAPSPPVNPNPTLGAHGTFLLEAHSPSVHFAPFVNQQVRVTGTMTMAGPAPPRDAADATGAAPAPAGTPRSGTPPPSGTPAASGTPTTGATPTSTLAQQAGAAAARVSFTVTAITMVAKTCS